MEYAVFANGTFLGFWEAENEAAAIQAAANEVRTDGNTDGMIAEPLRGRPVEKLNA